MNTCPITVVIPTYNRPDKLLLTLEKLATCNPVPSEIIIHIDGDDVITEAALEQSVSDRLKILRSPLQVGPGGGRTKAITEATNEIVASLDDDSYPIDSDYFSRLLHLFNIFPKAAVIAASIYHINEPIQVDAAEVCWRPDFIGCGCAYRKSVFLKTKGYIPLPLAYGVEEVDLALQLRNLDWAILQSSWLRVFHNTQLEHHSKPQVTAASIANLALLAYLRYPISFGWLGVTQCLNRIFWLLRNGRRTGIVKGILMIPILICQHQKQRQPVSAQSLGAHLRLHKAKQPTFAIPSLDA